MAEPTLYLVTDRAAVKGAGFIEAVEAALSGGVNVVQLRDKGRSEDEIVRTARELKELTTQYRVPLIINDSPIIAMLSGADGVHLGPSDGELSAAREYLGSGAIIGGSARTVERAIMLERYGADYLGAGAVFGTATKSDAKKLELKVLAELCRAVAIPVVAIGGVSIDNVNELRGAGIAGIAAVSSIMGADDPRRAAAELKAALKSIVEREFAGSKLW